MSEKMIIALFLVKERNGKESTIPVGFSVDSNLIPVDLKPFEIHFDNYVKIEVRGYQPVTAMIVVVGEDSQDLLAGYKTFVSKGKTHKPPNLQTKVSHWMPLSNLVDLKKSREFAVKPMAKKDFDAFIKFVENLQKPVNISCTPEIVNLDDNSNPASTSTKSSNLEENDTNKALKDLICSTKEKIKKLKEVTEVLVLTQEQKNYFHEIASIQENLINIFLTLKPMKNTGHSTAVIPKKEPNSSMADLRIIPEIDETKEHSKGVTFVEGLLPVKTTKYKKFCKSLPKIINDREPNAVITNFVKFCFPNHWLTGVTVAGKGNNKSLLSLWAYSSPLNDPVSGTYDESLGKARFDALIDHTMRKCGRKSYDSYTVGFLNNQVGKTMYYQRTRISVKKSQGSSRSTKDTTTESEDIEEDDPDYGQIYDEEDEDDEDDDEESGEDDESETTQDWEESQDKSSKSASSKVKEHDDAMELDEDKRFDWGGGFSQKVTSKVDKQAQRSAKRPEKEPEKKKDKEEEKSESKDLQEKQSGQNEDERSEKDMSTKPDQKPDSDDLVEVDDPQKSEEVSKKTVPKDTGGGLGEEKQSGQNEAGRSKKERSPGEVNSKTTGQKDNGEDLFDDDEDEFLDSMYTMEQELSGHGPLFGDEALEDRNPITSTPAKISAAIPAVGITPIQYKLNISHSTNKSEPDLNEIEKGKSSTSDSGISLSDRSVNIQQQANQPQTAIKEAEITSKETSDKKDIDQGTKRKHSDNTEIGSNKIQKNEENNSDVAPTTVNKPETSVKASTSSASSVQVTASIAPEFLALLSNPDNQKFLSTILAQMTKKN